MENAIEIVEGNLQETIPEKLLKKYKLQEINEAIKNIHFPKNFNDFKGARNRLVFEELLTTQLALLQLKNNYTNNEKGIAFNKEVKISEFINTLPFKLTKAQLRVIEEIDNNMEDDKIKISGIYDDKYLKMDKDSRIEYKMNVLTIYVHQESYVNLI